MRRIMIALAGLASVAGCAGTPPEVIDPMPVLEQTFVDPELKEVQACLTVVSRNTGKAGVIATNMATGPEGSVITIDAEGERWNCRVDDKGRVTAMLRA